MMMNFRSVKKKKERKKISLSVGLIILSVILGFTGVYRWLSSGFHPLARGFWGMGDNGSSFSVVFKDKKHLDQRVQDLEKEIETLRLENMRLEMFRLENETLKNTLTTNENYNPVSAAILVKPDQNLYNTLIVDAGIQDGVQEGDLVIAYGNVALGEVRDVRRNIAFVEMFSEPDISSVLVHNISSTYVDAVGHGNGSVRFTLPRDLEVTVGDFLSLPARSGFLFGTVESIDFESTDPVQTIIAQSAVNINQIQFVEIIPGYEEQF